MKRGKHVSFFEIPASKSALTFEPFNIFDRTKEKYPVRWKNEGGYQKNTLVFDWNNRYRQRGLVSLGRKSDVIARCISGILVGNEPRFPENVDVSIRVKRVQENVGGRQVKEDVQFRSLMLLNWKEDVN